MTAFGLRTVQGVFYRAEDAAEWDGFVAASANGGFPHARQFLDHHGDRFRDLSLVFRDARKGDLIGLMPIVADESGASIAISHAGSSFGGLVTSRPDPLLTGEMFAIGSRMLLAVGFKTLIYKTNPVILHRQPDETDLLFLTLAGRVTEFHLWSVVQVRERAFVGKKRQTAVRTALRSGLSVRQADAIADYQTFYDMLENNLAERHKLRPLHSWDQVLDLRRRLGEGSRLVIVSGPESNMLAASWVWDYGNGVWHSQYICSTPEGRRRDAVDVLILGCVELASQAGQRTYSLGRSTLADGWGVNQSLMAFKKRLGCGLAAQRRIEVDLQRLVEVSEDWLARR